jgi:hypothetical protein
MKNKIHSKNNQWFRWIMAACTGALFMTALVMVSCDRSNDILFTGASADPAHEFIKPEKRYDLSLVITGSNVGEFEPCGCGGVFEGGLSRRSTIIQNLKKINPNVVLVDTGDLTCDRQVEQIEFMDQAYHLLGYDAIALGEGDLRAGVKALNTYITKYRLPFVASNLKFTVPTSISEVLTVCRGGKKLAFISVISDRWLAILPPKDRKNMRYEPPAETLRRLVPELKTKKYDAIILLSHLGMNERKLVANSLAGVDLWIDNGGHQWVGRRRTASTQPAFLEPDFSPPLLVSWPNDRKVGIAGVRWQGGKLTVPVAEMIPVVREIKEDMRFIEIYDAYKYVSRQEMVNRLMSPGAAATSAAKGFPYVSSATCAACHQDIYNFWKKTKHATAFKTLAKTGREVDINCLACHTTGYREPGGFDNPLSTPELENVGCQSCHKVDLEKHHNGPADPRFAAVEKLRAKDLNIIKSWQCQRCHVPHRSPKFDYKTDLKKIKCSQVTSEIQTTRPQRY